MKKIRDFLSTIGFIGILIMLALLAFGSKLDLPIHYFGIYVFILMGVMILWKIIDMFIDEK